MRVKYKPVRILAKKLATKYNPYHLNQAKLLHDRIRRLLGDLRPMETGYPLIRVGQGADGGYLVPDDLNGIKYCFSPGVSNLVLFERDILSRYGIESFLCDADVDRPSGDFEFEFDKRFVGAYDDEVFMTMDAWYERYLDGAVADDLLLQMDIEGGEYPTLLSTSESLLARFRIIVVECHHLFKMLDYVTFPFIEAAFRRVLRTHVVVHVHPNNNQGAITVGDMEIPDVVEMTFLRRDRVRELSPATTFPHPLDQDVDAERKPLVLHPSWYE